MTARDQVARAMSESELLANIRDAANTFRWMSYHVHRSDLGRTEAGFPDLCLAHPQHGVIFAELKNATRHTTPEQALWLSVIAESGHRAFVWRPKDWVDGTILRALRGEPDVA